MTPDNLVDVNSLIDNKPQPSQSVDVNSLIEQPQKKNSLPPSQITSSPSTSSSNGQLGLPKNNPVNPLLNGQRPQQYSLDKSGFKPVINTTSAPIEQSNQDATAKVGLTPIQQLQRENTSKPDATLNIPNIGVFNRQVNAFGEVTDKTITDNAPDESVVLRNEYNQKRKGILNPTVVVPQSQLTPENNFGLTAPNMQSSTDATAVSTPIKQVQGAPQNEPVPPTPEQQFRQKVNNNLAQLDKETIAKTGEYAMKVTSDPVAAGFITKAVLGDDMAISQKRQIDKGYSVPQSDLYQTGQIGISSFIAALDKKYADDPQNADYLKQRADLENQSSTLIDKFPEYKTSQLTKAVAIELNKLHPEVANDAAMAQLYLPEIKKEMGLSDEDVKAIDFDNYPTSSFITSTIAPIYKGALGLGAFGTRVIGTALGADSDFLNSRITEMQKSPTFFDDINTMQNTGQTVDTNKTSPTFLQDVADPNKGKYNYNFHTISNAIGNGVGQLAWFVYGSRGIGAAANKVAGLVSNAATDAVSLGGLPFKLSPEATNEVGMAGLMIGQGYEDNYQKARTVISDKPEDEWKRNAFALLQGSLDYLGFRVLGNVVKGLPPTAEKEIGQVFKDAPNLASVNKTALQSKLTNILQGLGEAGKETAFVGTATTASEIAKAAVINVLGNDKAAEEENKQLPDVITSSIASLPFSMFLPIVGAKIIAGGQSKIQNENIYNAGLNPESYKGDANKLFDMGAINQQQLNDRIQVINTAHDVVKSIPSDVFDNLNHNQRVSYVNSKIKEVALKAKAANIQDDALSEFYNSQIKNEVAKRADILNGGGKDGEYPQSVAVIKPKTQEELSNQIPDTTIAPSENVPRETTGAKVVLPQTITKEQKTYIVTVGDKSNETSPKPSEENVARGTELSKDDIQFVKESIENGLAPAADKNMLLGENGKFDESKVPDYLKFVAQQSKGVDENGNVLPHGVPDMEKLGYDKSVIDLANEKFGAPTSTAEVNKSIAQKLNPVEPVNETLRIPENTVGKILEKNLDALLVRKVDKGNGYIGLDVNGKEIHFKDDVQANRYAMDNNKKLTIVEPNSPDTTPTEINKPISVNEGEQKQPPTESKKEKPYLAKYDKTPESKTDNINTAKRLLNDLGVDAHFSGYSDTNGISVYFEDANNKKYRISDHSVTNKHRMDNEVNLSFDDRQLGIGGKRSVKSNFEYNQRIANELNKPEQKQPYTVIGDKQIAPKEKPISKPVSEAASKIKNKYKDKVKGLFDTGESKNADMAGDSKRRITMPDGSTETVKPVAPEIVNGFYSPIEKKILNVKASKLSANKWNEFFGKGDEAKFTGMLDFLNSKKPNDQVSKQEVLDYIKNNRIQLVEVVKGDKRKIKELPQGHTIEETKNYEGRPVFTVYSDNSQDQILGQGKTLEDAKSVALFNLNRDIENTTKFSQYQLSGEKENYKEVLITMPSQEKLSNEDLKRQKDEAFNKIDFEDEGDWVGGKFNGSTVSVSKTRDGKWQAAINSNVVGGKVGTKSEALDNLKNGIDFKLKPKSTKEFFKSSHFDEPNILAHVRMSTRTDAEGKKVLFVDEVQSDFGQSYKKAQTEISDYLDKNENKVIEAFKKKGLLKVICP